MKSRLFFLFAGALLAAPLAVWADTNPDFDDDAKPILRMQPGLIEFVESRFDVKDTGTAKYPGDDNRPPQPPYIFKARPAGSSGPYTLRLLIQPGPVNHILNVVDITRIHPTAPRQTPPPQQIAANQAHPQMQPPAPQAPAPSQSPSEPTSDTPSGPIMDNGNQVPSSPTAPSLQPPPDPAPTTHD